MGEEEKFTEPRHAGPYRARTVKAESRCWEAKGHLSRCRLNLFRVSEAPFPRSSRHLPSPASLPRDDPEAIIPEHVTAAPAQRLVADGVGIAQYASDLTTDARITFVGVPPTADVEVHYRKRAISPSLPSRLAVP